MPTDRLDQRTEALPGFQEEVGGVHASAVGHSRSVHYQFRPPAFPSDGNYSLEVTTAETLSRLAKVVDAAYTDCVKEDGACARCFLIRISQALDAEGWEICQSLTDEGNQHGKGCTNV